MTRPSAPSEKDDAALVAVVQRGFRYALALTHDRFQAEDLVHESVVAMLRSGVQRTAPYLFTVIRNRYIDQLRHDERHSMHSIEDVDEAQLAALMEAKVEEAEPGRLESALGRLRPAEREVLLLACVEDLTCAQIAEIFGRPRGTVTSLLYRAQQKLRRMIVHGSSEALP